MNFALCEDSARNGHPPLRCSHQGYSYATHYQSAQNAAEKSLLGAPSLYGWICHTVAPSFMFVCAVKIYQFKYVIKKFRHFENKKDKTKLSSKVNLCAKRTDNLF